MNSALQQTMFRYYAERAPEYEEIYTLGRGPASISDPNLYTFEVQVLSKIVRKICNAGAVLDIGCGTAFWLPQYGTQCDRIVLLDQSESMLREAEAKITDLKIEHRSTTVLGDFFSHDFKGDAFDIALIGFVLSHLDHEGENQFFGKLRAITKPHGRFLFLDSVWSTRRAKSRAKRGVQERRLNDGRSFRIYKKYFSVADIRIMEARYDFSANIEHFGEVFLAVSGSFL
jgi:ubiquinone/menaquinone biosynthesis C-methylase UbiE